MTHALNSVDLLPRVQHALDEHLSAQRSALTDLGDPMIALVDSIADLLAGGKRLRAAFLFWGWRALGGADDAAAVRAASSMELFQAAALLHDDVMDNSDLRRGRPAAHRLFATQHQDSGWTGDPDRYGHAAAILAGDLCLCWTDELFSTSGLPARSVQRARSEFDLMRTQLMGGQFLDVLEGARGWLDLTHTQRLQRCFTVIRFKSARYSVEQPLLIGALAAGAGPGTVAGLTRYGAALGQAFQLRDDVLGVFGDPHETGKPAGDDLREGKHTVLIALALQHAAPGDADALTARLGDPRLDDAGVQECRDILTRSTASERTEALISSGAQEAREALADIEALSAGGREALEHLIEICTDRTT